MHHAQPRYFGDAPMSLAPWRGHAAPGHCSRCGEHSAACRCGCRECRREAKEVLVTPQSDPQGKPQLAGLVGIGQDAAAAPKSAAQGEGFVGGGCCVSLSVEYAPTTPTAPFLVELLVRDSEGTIMAWARNEPAGAGYQIKESVITTKPGAKLTVLASNCTARVRWCEVFSC